MIIGKFDLENMFKAGTLGISRRKKMPKFSAFSLDLRIGELYRHNHHWRSLMWEGTLPTRGTSPEDMATDEYVAAFLDRINLKKEGRKIPPGHYLWRPLEEISLDGNCFFSSDNEEQEISLGAEIVSRSSWARRSLRVQEAEDDLNSPGMNYRGRPLCAFTTMGPLVIRPHDAVAQLVITAYVDFPTVPEDEIAYLIDEGKMIVRRGGRNLASHELQFRKGGIGLTMDKDIKVYNGAVIDPLISSDHAFDFVDIQGGYVVSARDFFISSSAEYVEIPDGYVGYVTEFNYFPLDIGGSGPHLGPDPSILLIGFQVHPNAP